MRSVESGDGVHRELWAALGEAGLLGLGLPEAVGPGLVLAEPDDASASAARVAAWLACADVAAHQRAWLAAHHGTALCVDGLLALCQDGGP